MRAVVSKTSQIPCRFFGLFATEFICCSALKDILPRFCVPIKNPFCPSILSNLVKNFCFFPFFPLMPNSTSEIFFPAPDQARPSTLIVPAFKHLSRVTKSGTPGGTISDFTKISVTDAPHLWHYFCTCKFEPAETHCRVQKAL